MKTAKVFQTNMSVTTINELAKILTKSKGNLVAICNATTLVRCARDKNIRKVIENFSIKTADGFPVAKSISIFTKKKHSRVDGYKVFMTTLEHGLKSGTKHYFFGNDEDILEKMVANIKNIYPNIQVTGYFFAKIC